FKAVYHSPNTHASICLAAMQDGSVLVSSGFHLLKIRADGSQQDIGDAPSDTPRAQISVLFEDHSHAIWIGTLFGGLYRFNGAAFEKIPTSSSDIRSLAQDR